jgi:hypothetical protein
MSFIIHDVLPFTGLGFAASNRSARWLAKGSSNLEMRKKRWPVDGRRVECVKIEKTKAIAKERQSR